MKFLLSVEVGKESMEMQEEAPGT